MNTIADASFTSVVIHEGQVFAATYPSPDINVYSYKHNWSTIRSFKALKGSMFDWITLSVKNNHLKWYSENEGRIRVYTLTGQLVQTFGTKGSGDAGQFKSPYICDDDEAGSVLIADCRSNRLQVMTEEGEFSLLQLQPPVSGPRSAALFNNQLYITSSRVNIIYKYST